jgi:predicted DNA-binding transcriptional regulator YafY
VEKKKATLIYLLKVLEEESDSTHYLTQQEILDFLLAKYDLKMERKAVARSLALLVGAGYDIKKDPKGGYALLHRTIDPSELPTLIDAIYSSRSISGNQASKLSEEISSCLSLHDRQSFDSLYKSLDENRTPDKALFLNLRILSEAIKKKKKITFAYLLYGEDGEIQKSQDQWRCRGVSPYYLVNNFGRYYLLSDYEKNGELTIFRIESMADIEITGEAALPKEEVPGLGKNFSITDYVHDHVYLFGGKAIEVEVILHNASATNALKDWFGNNATIYRENYITKAKIITDEKAFFNWSFQYGEAIEVVAPKDLRKHIKETLKAMSDNYSRKNV